MPFRNVVVLSDRPDRGRAFLKATGPFAHCRIAHPADDWIGVESLTGVIADVSIDEAVTRQSLGCLSTQLKGRRLPLAYLMRTAGDGELRLAERLGATACFPSQTPPRVLVTGLFRQISPGRTMTDLLVEHSYDRAEQLLTGMFEAARVRNIDLDAVENEIDPVLQALRDGGLLRWLRLVETHDEMTLRHCLLVAGLAAHFALYLGLSSGDCVSLVRAALVHDVGKARIPLAILQKPGSLTIDELGVMRTHAVLGHELLLSSGMTDALTLTAARHHHEMLDGSGYPDGLEGTAISDPVRLLTICDIYAALAERRPYRSAMQQVEALRILRGMTPDRLEAALVEAFAASLADLHSMPGSSTLIS